MSAVLKAILPQGGINCMQLPTLDTLTNTGISDEMIGRLDVAYGLGFHSFDIGIIHPPHDIEDTFIGNHPFLEMVSKDQV